MRGAMKVLAATVLGLVLSLTVMGCEGALSPEADAQFAKIQASVDLPGTWVLNEEESEDPAPRGGTVELTRVYDRATTG